jgi:peptidoglycan/xylan/chitin deacetylase (PgdA/CDA1 family)
VPVLLYHAVGEPARARLEGFTSSPAVFREHLAVLADRIAAGATPMSITDYADALRDGRALPTRPFVVTFDDGYDDTIGAMTALADIGIPSVVYVTVDFIGRPGFMTPNDLRELAAHPLMEVGAHSISHPRLDELPRAEIAHQIGAARMYLQHVTGAPIPSVAYPHGNYDRRVLDEVRRAGHTSGAAVRNVLSRPGDNPLAIARWTVRDVHTADDVAAVMDGNLSIVGDRERIVTRGYRIVRRTRAALVRGRDRIRPSRRPTD